MGEGVGLEMILVNLYRKCVCHNVGRPAVQQSHLPQSAQGPYESSLKQQKSPGALLVIAVITTGPSNWGGASSTLSYLTT